MSLTMKGKVYGLLYSLFHLSHDQQQTVNSIFFTVAIMKL